MTVEGCLGCDLTAGRHRLPGGVIHEADGWVVEHCLGPLGVGTLVVKPRRHVTRVADLMGGEATALGPLLLRATQVVTELTDPEQTYVTLWSHTGGEPVHIHFVVSRAREWPGTGPSLLLRLLLDVGRPLLRRSGGNYLGRYGLGLVGLEQDREVRAAERVPITDVALRLR